MQKGEKGFLKVDNLLYYKETVLGDEMMHSVVQKIRKEEILRVAHDSIFAV